MVAWSKADQTRWSQQLLLVICLHIYDHMYSWLVKLCPSSLSLNLYCWKCEWCWFFYLLHEVTLVFLTPLGFLEARLTVMKAGSLVGTYLQFHPQGCGLQTVLSAPHVLEPQWILLWLNLVLFLWKFFCKEVIVGHSKTRKKSSKHHSFYEGK